MNTKPNRMIRLFQLKAEQAYEAYLRQRQTIEASDTPLNAAEWRDAVVEGTRLFERYAVWTKAAELLRKEELNK